MGIAQVFIVPVLLVAGIVIVIELLAWLFRGEDDERTDT